MVFRFYDFYPLGIVNNGSSLKKMWKTLPRQKMPCGGVLLQLRPWDMVIFIR
jgi:hypothetical protein